MASGRSLAIKTGVWEGEIRGNGVSLGPLGILQAFSRRFAQFSCKRHLHARGCALAVHCSRTRCIHSAAQTSDGGRRPPQIRYTRVVCPAPVQMPGGQRARLKSTCRFGEWRTWCACVGTCDV